MSAPGSNVPGKSTAAVIVDPASSAPSSEPTPRELLARSFRRTFWVSMGFSLVIAGVMVFNRSTASTNDPWKSPQLMALKEKLQSSPNDDRIKAEVQKLDLQFREQYRRRLELNRRGAWLLAAAILLGVFSERKAAELQRSLPKPALKGAATDERFRAAAQARIAVLSMAGAAGAGILAVSLSVASALPKKTADWQKLLGTAPAETPVAADFPSMAEVQANWPRFRGPSGNGICAGADTPLSWDIKTGSGILWKAAIPAPGHSSPVVWGNQVFISGATAAERELFCYDAATGQLLWRRAIEVEAGQAGKKLEVPPDTGYAASTPATDGRRVYGIFANGDLAAVSVAGAPVWVKHLGAPKNMYGYAASLAIWEDKLVVQFDQGDNPQSGSKLMAFDAASGRVLWERPRQIPASWATPMIIEAAGKVQVVALGVPWVIAYALKDGTEIWRAELLEGEITPSPIFAAGRVLAVCPSIRLAAIRPDGSGDVTKTHVDWMAEVNIPDVTSPVSNGELVFTVLSDGLMTCFDAKDGKKIWEHGLDMTVQASPAVAGNRVLVLSTQGVAAVVEAAREFREIGRSEFPDKFMASPAFAGGRVFLRGATNLVCLGAGGGEAVKEHQHARN